MTTTSLSPLRRPHDTAYHCSFCRKSQDEVRRLIAAPDRAYICNECVSACSAALDGTTSALALPPHTHMLTAADDETSTARCDFCGKAYAEVAHLIAAPDHAAYICNESLALCYDLLAAERILPARAGAAAARAVTPATRPRRHLLDLDDWTPTELRDLLASAHRMRAILDEPGHKLTTLRGLTLVNLFYENSTRTRVSFELAARRLSADVTTVTASASSVTKGESLVDTTRTLQALGANIIVIRSAQSGAPDLLARHFTGHVFNAGDGWRGHPSQALLDAYTITRHLGDLDGKRVVILGDILHSRVARSNVWALTALGAEVVFCAPPTLLPPAAAALYAARPVPGVGASRRVVIEPQIERALAGADVIMTLRLQRERQQAGLLPSLREYTARYGLSVERLRLARPNALVMHPGPMNEGVEIDPEVAAGAQSVIEEQVTNGVATRMAALAALVS